MDQKSSVLRSEHSGLRPKLCSLSLNKVRQDAGDVQWMMHIQRLLEAVKPAFLQLFREIWRQLRILWGTPEEHTCFLQSHASIKKTAARFSPLHNWLTFLIFLIIITCFKHRVFIWFILSLPWKCNYIITVIKSRAAERINSRLSHVHKLTFISYSLESSYRMTCLLFPRVLFTINNNKYF